MPTIGWASLMLPVEPLKCASPKAKIPPSVATSQYPLPVGVVVMPTIGLASLMLPIERSKGRALELRVPEGEDPAVLGHEPVALARVRRRHADDRLGQLDVAGRALEGCVSEGEDPAVLGHEPVPVAGGRRRHADDRLGQLDV